MWLFTQHGFFSVTRSVVEPEKFQVRARIRRDLENLLELMSWSNLPILQTPDADYRFRLIIAPLQVTELLGRVAEEIDYSNFKSRIGKLADQSEKLPALHDIWEIMVKFQNDED